MAPPKVGAPSRVVRNTQSTAKSIEQATTKVENPIQPEGIVDVDVIPSPVEEPSEPNTC
jgi:hypothetical protein